MTEKARAGSGQHVKPDAGWAKAEKPGEATLFSVENVANQILLRLPAHDLWKEFTHRFRSVIESGLRDLAASAPAPEVTPKRKPDEYNLLQLAQEFERVIDGNWELPEETITFEGTMRDWFLAWYKSFKREIMRGSAPSVPQVSETRGTYIWSCINCRKRITTSLDLYINDRPVCVECNAEMEPWTKDTPISVSEHQPCNDNDCAICGQARFDGVLQVSETEGATHATEPDCPPSPKINRAKFTKLNPAAETQPAPAPTGNCANCGQSGYFRICEACWAKATFPGDVCPDCGPETAGAVAGTPPSEPGSVRKWLERVREMSGWDVGRFVQQCYFGDFDDDLVKLLEAFEEITGKLPDVERRALAAQPSPAPFEQAVSKARAEGMELAAKSLEHKSCTCAAAIRRRIAAPDAKEQA